MEKNFLANIDFWAKILINISTVLFVGTIVILFATTFVKSKRFTFDKKLVLFTVSTTISIWCLQFLADYVNNDCPAETWYELLAFSFYHTLKSFGADDNLLMGIKDVLTLIPSRKFFEYRLFSTILAICAPITSATIFFEILSNFFPKVKLFLLRICFFKKKYYFSELNEYSLALTKSILDTEKGILPVIIFTDVYADDSHENTSELLAQAKRLGAICLRDDIIHIQKSGLGERKYFLIDKNEIANLQTFVKLTDKSNYKSLKKVEVYLFCQDYIYTDVEKQVRQKLNKRSVDDFVLIPVRSYRNLITNMLEKTPLYEAIVHQRNENSDVELNLNVTILGIGDIGTEMFLTTYWMGQMLNCKLNINVISRESEADFWGKIDYINPEIRHTVQKGDETLRVYNKGRKDENGNIVPDELNFAEPYASVNYISCDVESEIFRKLLEGEDGHKTVLDTHYFLISLGSDQANLSVANTIKNRIGKYHIEHKDNNDKTIINYVVYNAALSEMLNANKFVCSYDNNPDIYMQAVGGVEQVYRAENIFMSNYKDAGEAAAKDYDSMQNKADRAKAYKNRLKKGEYEYWSNLALRLHFKYKVFSANLIGCSIFDEENEYISSIKSAIDTYKNLARRKLDEEHTREQEIEFQHNMQWLEHRRWCAFLRTMGYRYTNDYKNYIIATQSHKQMAVKLHPCLVECDKKGVHGTLDEHGEVADSLITKDNDGNIVKINATDKEILDFDLLDQLTCELAKLKQNNRDLTEVKPYDFKQYDYPNNDYLDYV